MATFDSALYVDWKKKDYSRRMQKAYAQANGLFTNMLLGSYYEWNSNSTNPDCPLSSWYKYRATCAATTQAWERIFCNETPKTTRLGTEVEKEDGDLDDKS